MKEVEAPLILANVGDVRMLVISPTCLYAPARPITNVDTSHAVRLSV
jgi:hypothetical protein